MNGTWHWICWSGNCRYDISMKRWSAGMVVIQHREIKDGEGYRRVGNIGMHGDGNSDRNKREEKWHVEYSYRKTATFG